MDAAANVANANLLKELNIGVIPLVVLLLLLGLLA